MICNKCAKQNSKEIKMYVDGPGKRYICPECGHVLDWESLNLSNFCKITQITQ